MAVSAGYKQTEVGVIPEDWEVVPLGSLGLFSKGQGIRKDEANSGDLPCIRYGEIYTRHNDVIRSFFSWISEDIAKNSKRLRKGDLLFAGSGETKEEIGKCVAFVGDQEAYAGGDVVILSPTKGNSKFLGYLLNTPVVARQKASKGQGDAIVHISSSALSSIKIPFPPLTEQQAIAEALRDVDGLISGVDGLIAKKRLIKQGAMQELLTGQRRLPGFAGDWAVKSLAEICSMKSGDAITNANIDQFSNYPCYGGNGIRGFTSRFTHDGNYALIGRQGALCGNVFSVKGRFFASEHAVVVTASAKTDIHWLTYILEKMNLNQYSESSAQPGLSVSKILDLNVIVPPTKAEQTAIAQILADMDAELAALGQKRAKTVALKQGMMQSLLTGAVRLG